MIDWPTGLTILGILAIIAGVLIKIFKKNGNLKLPQEFYDIQKKVIELDVEFKNTSKDIKDINNKIDKLTELMIKYISEN